MWKIVQDSYVDYNLIGGTSDSVNRIMGSRIINENGEISYTGTVPRILAEGGFKAKLYARSGETNPEVLSRVVKILGHDYRPQEDNIVFDLAFNLSPRQGAARMGPDLSMENVGKLYFNQKTWFAVKTPNKLGLAVPSSVEVEVLGLVKALSLIFESDNVEEV